MGWPRRRVLALSAVCVGAWAWRSSGQPMTGRRVLLCTRTRGFRHESIPAGVAAIRGLAAELGLEVDHTEDVEAFDDVVLSQYSATIFLSTTGDILEPPQQAAFERYIRSGGGFVGIHAAADAEYDWAWYGGLVGAYFSSHPEIQMAALHVEDAAHASARELPEPWVRTDEWYSFRTNPRDAGAHVLLTLDESSYHGGTMGADHPIAWYHEYDGGRAWYTAGGHTAESFAEPLFLAHLRGGIAYAIGALDVESPGGLVRRLG